MAKTLACNIPFQSKYAPAGTKVDVIAFNYVNGGTCIRLMDSATQEPLLTASIYARCKGMPALPAHQFHCKDYSENTGVVEGLVVAGIALLLDDLDDTGFPLMALTGECLAAFNSGEDNA